MKYFYCAILVSLFLIGCKATLQTNNLQKEEAWVNVGVAEDFESYIDTASIRQENGIFFAQEKRVFVTPKGREEYIAKIRDRYAKMGKPEKADKWNDFSYYVYSCEYDCTNKRFRVLTAEDYDSTGKRIVRTVTTKKNLKWINVETETIGDYTFFFVCDYE